MKQKIWRRFGNELGLLALLAGLFLLFSCLNSAFFRLGNLQQLLVQMVELGFVTLGMSICIISGGFDPVSYTHLDVYKRQIYSSNGNMLVMH